MKTFEELIARLSEGVPDDKTLWKQLRHLLSENGTLQQLGKKILDGRKELVEGMVAAPMHTAEGKDKVLWIKGQINGIDAVLYMIFEAAKEPENEPTDEVSAEQRNAAP